MRKELKKLIGQRLRFTGEIERYGVKRGWKGREEKTVLLRNIRRDGETEVVTDHLWFTAGKTWVASGMAPGAKVAFQARVGKYVKGYQGYREDVISTVSIDYRLERPTKAEVIGGEGCVDLD